jgi:diguanylate cyclase (GGDEF)-like protein
MVRERTQLSHDALIDALTGLGNRRTFDQRIAADVARAMRHNQALSLLMVDLDHFKEINDRYGHTTGDTVLSAVGVMLQDSLRVADIACRYGGDEFAVILPETTKTEAWLVAEKLRIGLQELSIVSSQGQQISVRASLGVASFGPEHDSPLHLLEAADAALYRAKHGGRDRVELAAG